MKLLCLASYLDGDAQTWWSRLDPERRRSWAEATASLNMGEQS